MLTCTVYLFTLTLVQTGLRTTAITDRVITNTQYNRVYLRCIATYLLFSHQNGPCDSLEGKES